MRDVQSSIRLFQLFAFLDRLEMWHAVQVRFLLQRGLTLAQYSVLDTLWYVGTLAFEVPTGAITDRCGKRLSLLRYLGAGILCCMGLLLALLRRESPAWA